VDTTQMLKGVLDLAVLAVLDEKDGYGYDVVRRLREAGLEGVGDASVYGTLRRLFQAGALTSYVVPSDSGPTVFSQGSNLGSYYPPSVAHQVERVQLYTGHHPEGERAYRNLGRVHDDGFGAHGANGLEERPRQRRVGAKRG